MLLPVLIAGCNLGLLWSYVLFVSVLDETVFGVSVGLRQVLFMATCGFVAFVSLGRWALRSQKVSSKQVYAAAATAIVTVLGALVVDVAYSGYLNLQQPRTGDRERARTSDRNTWIGELYPDLFYPAEKNYRLHKPNRVVEGSHYGDMYTPDLLHSKILVESVLSLKHVRISINENGFRGTKSFEDAKIVALGDSFTFGWGVNEGGTWVELLGRSLGKLIYNLGIHDSSPKQEFLLLEHLLEEKKLKLDHGLLLWLIFEGNDLEDSYETFRQTSQPTVGDALEETLLSGIWKIPRIIKKESVFDNLRSGRATFARATDSKVKSSPYWIDGVRLATPLYRSAQFGYKLFLPSYIERAQSPREYVADHPNRASLHQTFQDMTLLARKHDFRVVVLVAPTDARLYEHFFEDFPTLSERPYFIDAVVDEAGLAGLELVNFGELLQPYAEKELLYFRDDDHWNERGHEVASEIISRYLSASRTRLP
jgi:hypothetical protein